MMRRQREFGGWMGRGIVVAIAACGLVLVSLLLVDRASDGEDEGTDVATESTASGAPSMVAPPAMKEAQRIEQNPAFGTALLLARFVDRDDASISGVIARLEDPGSTRAEPLVQVSSADGTIRIEVPIGDSSVERRLVYQGKGRIPGSIDVTLRAGTTTDLGRILLESGGTVSGIVVNSSGLPIGAARVWTGSAEQEELLDDGHLSRRGPGYGGTFEPAPDPWQAQSDARGRFTISGVRPGAFRVWAHADGTTFGWSDPLRIGSNEDVSGVRIVVRPLVQNDQIGGVVLLPNGKPLPGAVVMHSFEDEGYAVSDAVEADDEGRFQLILSRLVPHDFEVATTAGEWEGVKVEDVPPGTLDLVLQLQSYLEVELSVHDAQWRPIPEHVVELVVIVGEQEIAREATLRSQEEGVSFVAVPASLFLLRVSAQGYTPCQLGPFTRDSVPDRIDCPMKEVPAIRGYVLAQGLPVEGAELRLFPSLAVGHAIQANGFPVKTEPDPVSETSSDSEGVFALEAPVNGKYYVTAEAVGFATAQVGPLLFESEAGIDELRIDLGEGGTLIVHVRSASGEEHEPIVVGITNGDYRPQTRRTEVPGTMQFDRLSPGLWLVRETSAELVEGHMVRTTVELREDEEFVFPWTCEVFSGRSTEYTLNASPR